MGDLELLPLRFFVLVWVSLGFPCVHPHSILLDRCGFGAGFHCRPADGQSWLWFGGGFHC